MSEITSEVPMVTEALPTRPQGIIRRLGHRVLEGFKANVLPLEDKVPLENINPQTVAWTIQHFLGVSALEASGRDRYDNGVSMANLLSSMGYCADAGQDYMKKYPKPYAACRRALQQLVNEGVLEMVHWPNADKFKEATDYSVTDHERLEEFAKEGGTTLKR